ncbi:chromatin assembly factor 1 subunit A isoform 2-T3 [Anomaloglossus baeobatrachus]|uniref:chromatin assembly factor 1 subunit A isoform X2 n=1 Tax=Anomaloglossus baeobatrachus TaxID=238106 RepID=UPI003F500385
MPGKGDTGEKAKQRSAVKTSSANSSKKMVQARLPFKRLNPVPKDGVLQGKKQKVSQKMPSVNTICPLDISLEDTENGSETADFGPLPKAVNGMGPLDNYIRKTKKTCSVTPTLTIDLTEDSNSAIQDQIQSNGIVQSLPSSGTVPVCGKLHSMASTHDTKAHDSSNVNRTEHSCNTEPQLTAVERLSPPPLEVPSGTSLESTSLLASPVKAEDQDLSTEDSPTRLSSTSSPVSTGSPEAHSSNQRDVSNSSSPTIQNKEKKRKFLADKTQRIKVKEEEKLAKEKAKEEAKKKKEEERELKAKERKEKKEKENQEKAEKLRLKEEKKKEKLEAIEAKQEEKRKKEEEKRIKIEEKRVKAEKAEITRFLQKSKTSQTPKTFAQSCGKFAPFEIKKNMAVAPLCRVEFEQETSDRLDKLLQDQDSESLFLKELKGRNPRRMGQTRMPQLPNVTSESEDIQILENTDEAIQENIIVEKQNMLERRKLGKMKLFQFCENYRPAYWGTWNRSSTIINPRKPWAQDTKLLDYELDSDEEWEEEEPGESLSHSEGDEDDDDNKEDDDEDDDGFFVPHGYLSEDEGGASDEECKNPENQKVRQRLKAKEWDELQSKGKKINILKPLMIGCVWLDNDSVEVQFLQKYAACLIDPAGGEDNMVQETYSNKGLQDREILTHLLPLLHGNVNGSKTIIKEFQECCHRGMFSFSDASNPTVCETVSPNSRNQNITIPSKARLKRIISENSVYEKRPDHRLCWYVHADVLKSFQQENLPVPCQWTYITQVNSCSKDEAGNSGGQTQAISTSSKRKSAGSMSITKFMKKAKTLGKVSDVTTLESDGFQADTEEEEDDDEDEDDCLILEPISKEKTVARSPCRMEITLNEETANAV